jgi:hypothetical protein
MKPSMFICFIYAFWLVLVAYLTVSAIGVKKDTQGHLMQSFGLLPLSPRSCYRIYRFSTSSTLLP